jgi:hypothetical protein
MAQNAPKTSPHKKRSRLQKYLIAAGILVAVYAIGLANPITGPSLQYPYYEMACGRKPVITESIMNKRYYTSEMKSYKVRPLTSGFYCTEEEAQSHGYHKSLAP